MTQGHSSVGDSSPPTKGLPPAGLMVTAAGSGFSGIYYAGYYYYGTATTSSSVTMTMFTPNDTGVSGDVYFLLMSLFDSSDAYDQIGLASTHGNWEVFYSAWANCAASGAPISWSNNSYPLLQNTEYTFEMEIYSGGNVYFAVFAGATVSGTLDWHTEVNTGATTFEISGSPPSVCSADGDSTGYTDYEEVHTLIQQTEPNWNFWFDDNLVGGSSENYWYPMSNSPPAGTDIETKVVNGNDLGILNQPFGVDTTICSAGQGACIITISSTSSSPVTVDETDILGGVYMVALKVVTEPSGYSTSFSPSGSGQTPQSSTLTVTPNGCTAGQIRVEATDQSYLGLPASYSTVMFQVEITGCGGGGCVAFGTPILTPFGYVPIQNLANGAPVEEFNFTTGSLMAGRLVSANATQAGQLIDVNSGLLFLTPTDQPIFIQNSTYTGWLRDPLNLSTADSMFDPVTHYWIRVTSVGIVTRHVWVFDVVTNGADNFVADGVLLDKKT